MNVIVTGCGGDIGQSIGKILSESNLIDQLIGTDLDMDNFGYIQFNTFEVLPACSNEYYFIELDNLIAKYKIDLIIPTSEPEIKVFCENGYISQFKTTPVLMASEKALRIGFDKLETVKFLKANQLLFPQTEILSDSTSENIPAIIKSRNGSGSKNIFVVRTTEEYFFYKKMFPDFIIQELLLPADEEYTCGLYRNGKREIHTIVIKRKLMGGSTGYGEVIYDKKIETLLINIAEKIELHGSINVQLRKTSKGPVVFEINPRFSSTVLFRHLMGFCDLIWSIEDKFDIEQNIKFEYPTGKKVYRGYDMRVK